MHGLREEGDEHLVVVRHRHGRDFRQALQGDVAKHGNIKELEDKSLDQFRLEDVSQRDPVEKAEECFEGGAYKRRVLRVVQDELTERENFRELRTHCVLKVFGFCLCHLKK